MTTNNPDLDSLRISSKKTKNQGYISLLSWLSLGKSPIFAFFCVFGLIYGLISPTLAEASVFSFVSNIFNGESRVSQEEKPINSQNMPLLQAPLTANMASSRGGGEITIVGGTSLLPETGPSGTIADIEESVPSSQISIYVVRSGDTLSQIADMYEVSVNTIVWANDIKGRVISPGQTLVILPISGVKYVVKKGDTLQSIAKKYKADVKEILQYNNLAENAVLASGENIIIPDGEIEAATSVGTVRVAASTSKIRGAGGPAYEGYFMRPIGGGSKSQGLHGYNGVDLAASIGTPVYASASGEVIISKNYGWNGGYGQYIVIQHDNGTQTLYAHLSDNVVGVGYRVVKGQAVGAVGNTGKSTGPHLHFEIRGARNPF